ncbi:hypothetical protein BDV10DRAFT_36907 [Aspergillus recurvatus]
MPRENSDRTSSRDLFETLCPLIPCYQIVRNIGDQDTSVLRRLFLLLSRGGQESTPIPKTATDPLYLPTCPRPHRHGDTRVQELLPTSQILDIPHTKDAVTAGLKARRGPSFFFYRFCGNSSSCGPVVLWMTSFATRGAKTGCECLELVLGTADVR